MTIETRFEYPADEPVMLIRRVFEAPRRRVWDVLSSAEHVPLWYGPRGSRTIVKEMDFRVGGRWRYALQEGEQAYEFFGEYLAIEPIREIRQTFAYMDFPPSVETMTLEDLGLRTEMVVRAVYNSMEAREGMRQSGVETGAAETYERLDELLAHLAR